MSKKDEQLVGKVHPMNTHSFDSGAKRQELEPRFDLISPNALRRLAMTTAEGAKKYGEHNWRNGIPSSNLLNHAINHIYEYIAGDRSEDHLAHGLWELMAAIENNELRPELEDFWFNPKKR